MEKEGLDVTHDDEWVFAQGTTLGGDNGIAVAYAMALLADKVDCVIIDNEPAKAYVAANEGLKVLETSYAVEEYAACIAKNNTELLEKFDAALVELINDGTVAEIIGKYIKAE